MSDIRTRGISPDMPPGQVGRLTRTAADAHEAVEDGLRELIANQGAMLSESAEERDEARDAFLAMSQAFYDSLDEIAHRLGMPTGLPLSDILLRVDALRETGEAYDKICVEVSYLQEELDRQGKIAVKRVGEMEVRNVDLMRRNANLVRQSALCAVELEQARRELKQLRARLTE